MPEQRKYAKYTDFSMYAFSHPQCHSNVCRAQKKIAAVSGVQGITHRHFAFRFLSV